MQAAYENDITKGTNIGQTLFGPWDSIRRDQVVSMIVRGAKSLFPGMFKEPPVETGSYFAGVSEPHGANLRTAQYNGLLDGLLGMGTGWQNANATRGEVAKMLFNMLSLAPASPLSPESIANARRLGGTSHIGETLYFVIGAKLTTELEAQHVLERMGNEIHGLQFYFTVQKSDNFEGMEPGWWVVFEARRTSATGYDMDWYQRGFPDAIVVQATVRTSDPIPVYEDIVGGFD
ncbi:MAG: hypothetical protein GX113_01590 [Actinobacteria bacterium]|nr:hypothetical protein [Actinomycetota bacterium]